jgi:hypothetical protein
MEKETRKKDNAIRLGFLAWFFLLVFWLMVAVRKLARIVLG